MVPTELRASKIEAQQRDSVATSSDDNDDNDDTDDDDDDLEILAAKIASLEDQLLIAIVGNADQAAAGEIRAPSASVTRGEQAQEVNVPTDISVGSASSHVELPPPYSDDQVSGPSFATNTAVTVLISYEYSEANEIQRNPDPAIRHRVAETSQETETNHINDPQQRIVARWDIPMALPMQPYADRPIPVYFAPFDYSRVLPRPNGIDGIPIPPPNWHINDAIPANPPPPPVHPAIRSTHKAYHVVWRGYRVGIFNNWPIAEAYVKDYRAKHHRGYHNWEVAARGWIEGCLRSPPSEPVSVYSLMGRVTNSPRPSR